MKLLFVISGVWFLHWLTEIPLKLIQMGSVPVTYPSWGPL